MSFESFLAYQGEMFGPLPSIIPPTGFPFSMGCWFFLESMTALVTPMAVSDLRPVALQNSISIQIAPAGGLRLFFSLNGTGTVGTTSLLCAAGIWYYVLCRFPDAGRYYASLMTGSGGIQHATNTAGISAPVGMTDLVIGSRGGGVNRFRGAVAEAWWAGGDVLPGGGATPDDFIRRLAQGGPFADPSVSRLLAAYRPSRIGLGIDPESVQFDDNWITTGVAKLGPHPPFLVEPYPRPVEAVQPVMF